MSVSDYELVDAGDGRRLERFGDIVVDRPAPGAREPRRADSATWRAANLRFDREHGWIGTPPDPWTVDVDGIVLELRPTPTGQVGLFPEHLRHWPWLREQIAHRPGVDVLNLFAYTGAATLVVAKAGARVTHVDASRPAVGWARRNAELSALADQPIRWIVDDTLGFVRREARRGRRYGGIVLDPPSYGHGPDGRRWQFRDALPDLIGAIAEIATDDVFVLLTAHTGGVEVNDLDEVLRAVFGGRYAFEAGDAHLLARSRAVIPLGVEARMIRR
jgi:23S rRNA (cytosine1962-C5)-methyltransferase